MKICYIAVDVVVPYYRGASTHVYEIAKNLTSLGHTVHVISRRISPIQPAHEVLNGIKIHRLYRGMFFPLPFSRYNKLRDSEELDRTRFTTKMYTSYLFTIYSSLAGFLSARIIRRYGLDIIIERETSFGAGAIASILTNKPLILELIGPRYSKRSITMSKKIILYTQSMLQDPVQPEKLFFVTAATDTNSFKSDSAAGISIREKYLLQFSPIIGYVGTFPNWHGIEELIYSSIKVLKRFPNTKFLMVGPYYKYAKELTEKLGISDAYIFTGPVPYQEVPRYINAADIMVAPYNPSRNELRRKYGIGSPIKIFEYMACGKPVITTELEPITNVVQNGKTGIIVPPGDTNSLSEALIRLLENPKNAEEMGKSARMAVEDHYSWRSLAKRIEKVLEECVSQR